jgi:tetratricopeptide (TPR) repeat protein
VHLHLGAILMRRGEIAAARRELRGELLLRPEDPLILRELGNLFLDARESRAAVACFKRLAQLEPSNVAAWLNLAVAHFMRKRFEDGVACCEEALRLEPRNRVALYNLALANGHLREYSQAIVYAQRGLDLAPRDPLMQRLDFRLRVLRLWFRITSLLRSLLPTRWPRV